MQKTFQDLLFNLGEKFFNYLPNLLAGVALLLVGWFLGWLLKRVIMQVSVILKLERYLIRFRWGEDFSKADVRYGLYNFIGNIVFLVIFLIFLNDALSVWQLTILSNLLEKGILFLPKVIIAAIVLGIGWLIAIWVARSVQRTLQRENIPRPTLVSRFVKTIIILFFSAMALTEMDIAREIVIIGFSVIFISLAVIVIVLITMGGKSLSAKLLEFKDRE
jgi:hypothetical protein